VASIAKVAWYSETVPSAAVASVEPVGFRPLHRREYDRLVEQGCFDDEKVELLAGMLVRMSPQSALHADVVARLARLLERAIGDRAMLRTHSPLALGDDSEPEPDVAVVRSGDFTRQHPTGALLVIEVAASSLDNDRRVKATLYAAAGIPEYWIVDLAAGIVEVHTAPTSAAYTRVTRHARGEALRLAELSGIELRLADVLPDPAAP
jgi:Uma2 family endonuclease